MKYNQRLKIKLDLDLGYANFVCLQTNFLVCLSLSVIIAYPFRTWLSYKQVGATIRHCVEIFFGLLLTYFCFGTWVYFRSLFSLG
jgi:hypothetical protein